MNDLRRIIRRVIEENKLYPSSVEMSAANRLNDSSDELKNLIAIFGLFRQQRPFNQIGDINKIQSREELQRLYDTWLEATVKELVKTKDFLDNKEVAIKYVTAYKDNVRKLGQQARPFSVRNAEKELIDIVNNNNWIKDRVTLGGATSIYSPAESDVIYKDEDIWIVKGDTKAKCVSYGAGKTWCITKPDLNYYTTYRIKYGATIFFCMQPNVKGPEHTFVLMNYGGGQYAIADETNTGDRHGGPDLARPWSEIEQEIPNLRGKEKYFQYIPISEEERGYSELVSRYYDKIDLGPYILEKTKNLVVNGGIITPSDFIRDYVAHGNEIMDRQFKFLTDEIKDSLIESGMKLTDRMFDELKDAQKRRYIVVRINAEKGITEHQFLSAPENVQNDYISKIDLDGIADLLNSSLNQDVVLQRLGKKGLDFVSDIDSWRIYSLLSHSRAKDKLINTLLSYENFISNLDSNGIDDLIRFSSNPDVVLQRLGQKGIIYISSLNLDKIRYLINKNSNPDKVIDTLLSNEKSVSSLDLNMVRILLNSSSNKDKLIDQLLSYEKFVLNLDSDGIVYLLSISSNPDKVVDRLLSYEKFISNINPDVIIYLTSSSSNPEKIENILRKHGKLEETALRKNIRKIIRESIKDINSFATGVGGARKADKVLWDKVKD